MNNIASKKWIIGTILTTFLTGALGHSYFKQSHDFSGEIRIGYTGHSINYGSVMVAAEKGLFENNGVVAELIAFKSGSQGRLALATGKIDAAFLSIPETLMAIDAGVPIKMVAPIARASTGLFVRPNDARTFADLAGKRIVGDAGTSRLEFIREAEREGFGPDQFTFIEMDSDYREMALLQQESVDAIPTSKYKKDNLIKAGAVLHEEWESKGHGGVFNPHTYLVVGEDFLAANPDTIGKVIDAIIEAQYVITAQPEEASVLVSRHIETITGGVAEYGASQIEAIWRDAIKVVAWIDPGEILEIADYLYNRGEVRNPMSLDQIFNFSFKDKLEKAQMELNEIHQ